MILTLLGSELCLPSAISYFSIVSIYFYLHCWLFAFRCYLLFMGYHFQGFHLFSLVKCFNWCHFGFHSCIFFRCLYIFLFLSLIFYRIILIISCFGFIVGNFINCCFIFQLYFVYLIQFIVIKYYYLLIIILDCWFFGKIKKLLCFEKHYLYLNFEGTHSSSKIFNITDDLASERILC